MKYLKLLLLSITLMLSPTIFAKPDFSETQIKNMQNAYKYGRSKPLKFNGSRVDFGYIMAAIIWQETSAGINCGTGKHAVGHYQNLITTVKSRMAQEGVHKSRSQIASELKNPNTSAYWARVEMQSWLKVHNGNIHKALASYNAGWASNKGASYSRNVIKKANYLKDNNILKVER
ncbi:transglycosylase SLT domain-containing protein [Acinetobacter baumannii]